jgi:hypothetical protein
VELEQFFIINFFNELRNQWEISNAEGITHNVEFNVSTITPLLTNGWEEIQKYYGWTEFKKISLIYNGNNKFMLYVWADQLETWNFPSFHSLSTAISSDHSFLVYIDEFPTFDDQVKSISYLFILNTIVKNLFQT